MLKKIAIVAGAGALLLGLFFGRDSFSYVWTSVTQARQAVKDSVPIEFELDRARGMIKAIDPEIQRSMHLIAKEEVQVDQLKEDIAEREQELATAREQILRLKRDLDEGSSQYVYAGRTYTSEAVRTDLRSRFDRFKTSEATTENLRQVLAARERGLEAARQKLTEMQAAKRQLEVDVENLEARMAMVEVAQARSDLNIDDSQLARTKELLTEISTRIEVAEKLVNADIPVTGEIPLDEPTTVDDVSAEVAQYFGEDLEGIEDYVQTEE